MRKLILVVLLALPAAIAVTLPARVALHFVDLPPGLETLSGTVWSGRAVWRQPRQVPINVRWRWRPPARWQWQATGGATEIQGTLTGLAGGPVLQSVTGRIETDRLDLGYWLPGTRALGTLELDLSEIRLDGSQDAGVTGRILWERAELVGSVNAGLGRIRVTFEPDADRFARFESLDSADIQLSGHLTRIGRDYQLNAWLEAADHRSDLRQPLARLGTMGPDGRVHIRYQGPLGW